MSALFNALPNHVTITEVGPRDGLQNITPWIPTTDKLKVIDALLATGIKSLEVTSFVSPKAIPQMADAEEVARYVIQKMPDIDIIALVPNSKGAELALNAGIEHINYVISASPEHNLANIRRTHEASLSELQKITTAFPELMVTVSIATAFGCPFTGAVPMEYLQNIIEPVQGDNIQSITLCDTIGVANPLQVEAILNTLKAQFPKVDFGLHLHDTHGLALANTVVGLRQGITRFETAVAGLGGCPFAPGAAGNCASEDLINMLQRMGITTGLNLERYIEAAQITLALTQSLGGSHLAKARSYNEFNFYSERH